MTNKNKLDIESNNLQEDVPIGRKVVNEAFDWMEIFVFSAAFVIIMFSFVLRMTIVQGASMEDTLIEDEFVAVSDIYFTPKLGDIVVIHDKSNTFHKDPLVKRVIATEGQTVDIDFDTWTVKVDGSVIDEPYIKLTAKDNKKLTSDLKEYMDSENHFIYTVPENHVFVMGDNRNNSADSRSSEVGPVDVRCIVGKAVVRVFPVNKFSFLG